MKIFGLNIASNATSKNGRGWIDPATREFAYLPIQEDEEPEQKLPTYRDLGFPDVRCPHLPVHLDPEFETFTYGHNNRVGDTRLQAMLQGDVLFFYATLDILPRQQEWGVYIIGYFVIDHVKDTGPLNPEQIKSLEEFKNNAHLKRINPKVDLLVKGSIDSRLYKHAIQLSHPQNPLRLHPTFTKLLKTVTGKPVDGGTGWYRWLLYSTDQALFALLRNNL